MHTAVTARMAPWAAAALALAVLLFAALTLHRGFQSPMGHDQVTYLWEAERMLAGDVLYGPHLYETNPPVIIAFTALPVLAAKGSHAGGIFWLQALVVAMIACSSGWTYTLARRGMDRLCAVLFACGVLLIEVTTAPADFGQREHLFLLLAMPYVVAAATGMVDRLGVPERVALGAAAGLAVWLKPQQVLVLIALEVFLAVAGRSLRRLRAPEILSLIGTSLLILAAVLLAAPLYLSSIYPLLGDTYWAIGTQRALPLLRRDHSFLAALTVLTISAVALRRRIGTARPVLAVIACAAAAEVAFAIQHTSWEYHAYPYRAMEWLAALLLVILIVRPFAPPLQRPARFAATVLASLAALTATGIVQARNSPRPAAAGPLDAVLDTVPPGSAAYIMSSGLPYLSAVYTHNLRWGSRFMHLWMMPALIQNERGPAGNDTPFKRLSPSREAYLANLQRTQSAEDLDYFKPSLVLVEHCSVAQPCLGYGPKDVDELQWFAQSPEFRAAWLHYERGPDVGTMQVFRRTR